MAYVDARPRYACTDAKAYQRSTHDRWNPRQQEVIVIDDSPQPEQYAYYNEPPSNNTRAAYKRRRLPEQAVGPVNDPRGENPYTRPPLPPPVQFRAAAPYESFIATHSQQYPQYGQYAPTPSSSSTTQAPYSYAMHGSDYRSSHGSPYILPPEPAPNNRPHKRKRNIVEQFPDPAPSEPYPSFAVVNAQALNEIQRHRKNTEVVLRKEPDLLPNFRGTPYDDKHGHYEIVKGSDLTNRYQIDRLLGQGTFGKVVRAYDKERKIWVAIKIIRAIQKYRDSSMVELRVLRTLQESDPRNRYKCIHLQDCFDFRNHVCIVTELLNQSIFDFLQANSFAPFPNHHIIHFAQQLFVSVAFLHRLNLIHTDLKPENILLVSNQATAEPYHDRSNMRSRKVLNKTDIRLIDFGSATFQDEYHSSVVSTRHYRAPEIILGMGWSFPCDIWSIGCILIEFFTGAALFRTHENLEHLAIMEVVAGRIDGRMIRSCSKVAQKMFRPSGRLDYPNRETSKDSRKFVKDVRTLTELLPPKSEFNFLFCDLLQKIFVYDPAARITAPEALKHPLFGIRALK